MIMVEFGGRDYLKLWMVCIEKKYFAKFLLFWPLSLLILSDQYPFNLRLFVFIWFSIKFNRITNDQKLPIWKLGLIVCVLFLYYFSWQYVVCFIVTRVSSNERVSKISFLFFSYSCRHFWRINGKVSVASECSSRNSDGLFESTFWLGGRLNSTSFTIIFQEEFIQY